MKFKSLASGPENPWVALILISATVFVIYSNVYDGPFVFDGKIQIEDKEKIRDLKNYMSLKGFFSHRPLTAFSFAVNYRLGKLEPFGYHLGNILIHAVNGILAYLLALCVFSRLSFFSSPKRPFAVNGDEHGSHVGWKHGGVSPTSNHLMALLTALIFVAHPIQTQSVTYMVQRYTSMAAMFYLLSVLFYIKARQLQFDLDSGFESGMPAGAISPDLSKMKSHPFCFKVLIRFFFFLFFSVLAMLCKENAASLFGVILLLEYFLFDRSWAGWRRKLIWLVPASCLLAFLVLYLLSSMRGFRFENLLEDVSILTRETKTIDRWGYFCTQFTVLVQYIRLLFFPVGQNLDHLYPMKTGFFEGLTPLAFIFVLAVIFLGVWNIKKRPAIGFGIFWFFITLSIESSIFPISDAMFEHRLYLPMFGFAVSLVYGVFEVASGRKAWAGMTLLAVVLAFGIGTYLRNRVWQDPLALWSDVVLKSPHNHRAYYNLGNILRRRQRLDDARRHYEKALELRPDFAFAHDNLGLILMQKGIISEAFKHIEKAVRIKPGDANIQNNFGHILLKQGRIKEAAVHFHRAIQIKPGYAKAQNNLGITLAQQGKLKEALKHLSIAARLDPENSGIQNNLGQVLMLQGHYEKAFTHFKAAIRMSPDFAQAQMNFGFLLLRQGKPDEAARHFKTALKLNQGLSRARQGLKEAIETKGSGWGPL